MNAHINKTISTVFAALAYWAISAAAYADPVKLESVDFAALPGDRFQVVMTFSDTPPQADGYKTDDPARIVLDFPGVESALEQKKYALAFENARSFTALSAGERTRVVLSLLEMVPYQTRVEGNVVTVDVGSAVSQGSTVADSASGSGAVSSSGASITDVDFRRGEIGDGQVSIELSDPGVNVDVDHVGNEIRVSFYQTGLPERLDRRLDVVDFATPVKTIDTSSRGSTTQVVIEALGDYDYAAYQVDGRYIVDVKPLTPRELEEKRSKFAYTGEEITLQFQDIPVRSVLDLIALQGGINIMVSDSVGGSVTLRLDNVPWDQALDLVLKNKGLDKRQEGNVIYVGPAEEIAAQERIQLESKKQLAELAPLRTEFIRINYADAEELFALYVGDKNANAGTDKEIDRGEVRVDQRTNTIIITDTDENIASFRRLVRELDVPIRQVEIEARIVTANTDFREELGVQWGIAGKGTFNGNQIGASGTESGFASDSGGSSGVPGGSGFGGGGLFGDGTIDLDQVMSVDLGVADPAGSLAVAFLSDNIFLDLELSALEEAGQGEIIAQPSVTTGDKQEAIIETGQEVPFLEATSSGAASLQFKEALLKLQVTPQITPDNRIDMNLLITQDAVSGEAIGLANSTVPIIDVTRVQTTALVGNGQTIVLGGIFQIEERQSTRKVPVLGDIPYVGKLFRRDTDRYEKREILIFITPKIIDASLID